MSLKPRARSSKSQPGPSSSKRRLKRPTVHSRDYQPECWNMECQLKIKSLQASHKRSYGRQYRRFQAEKAVHQKQVEELTAERDFWKKRATQRDLWARCFQRWINWSFLLAEITLGQPCRSELLIKILDETSVSFKLKITNKKPCAKNTV